MLDNIILSVGLGTLIWVLIEFYKNYTGAFGSTLDKVWTGFTCSATLVIAKLGKFIAAIVIVIPELAQGISGNDQLSDALKTLLDAKYYAIYTIFILAAVTFARNRTLKTPSDTN